jgi:WD40 repeat protein
VAPTSPPPDLAPSSQLLVTAGGVGCLQACAVAESDDSCVAGGQLGTIGIWQLSTGLRVGSSEGHSTEVSAVRITPDAAWVVTPAEDGTVRIWDVARRRLMHALPLHDGPALHCAVSPGSTRAALIGEDNVLRVIDLVWGDQVCSAMFDDPRTQSDHKSLGRCVLPRAAWCRGDRSEVVEGGVADKHPRLAT